MPTPIFHARLTPVDLARIDTIGRTLTAGSPFGFSKAAVIKHALAVAAAELEKPVAPQDA